MELYDEFERIDSTIAAQSAIAKPGIATSEIAEALAIGRQYANRVLNRTRPARFAIARQQPAAAKPLVHPAIAEL